MRVRSETVNARLQVHAHVDLHLLRHRRVQLHPRVWGEITAILLLKRVHESCAAEELVAAQLARVLRKALLAPLTSDAEDSDEDSSEDEE